MLDRIDLHVHLPRISVSELRTDSSRVESSEFVRQRVCRVREVQYQRQSVLNSKLAGVLIEQHCGLEEGIHQFLEIACERLHLSARAYHRIIRLARTIADMADSRSIEQAHIAEAIGYRSLDRQ